MGREAQRDELRRAILQNPTEHGFGTELWTLKRGGVVIKRMRGVTFRQTQIWRILGSLGFISALIFASVLAVLETTGAFFVTGFAPRYQKQKRNRLKN